MSDDPSTATADLARWAEQMQQKAERFQTLQGRLARISVTEQSADKSVQITIDNNGIPTDIRFGADIRRKNPAALSTEVMSCLNRARQRLVEQVTATVHETVGDDPIGANILEKFPKPPAPGDSSPGAPAAEGPTWSSPAQEPTWSSPSPTSPTPPLPAPTADTGRPRPTPIWNDPTPPEELPGASRPTPPTPPAEPAQPSPRRDAAGAPANPASLIPDVEDEETEYYRNKSWLI